MKTMMMGEAVTVSKRDLNDVETWRYPGELLHRDPKKLIIRAFFDQDEVSVHDLQLRRGDYFIEYYYFDRWFNILEIYDPSGSPFKGWYCNIAMPSTYEKLTIRYVDLALDLIVFPRKDYLVLDYDEFEALELTPGQREKSLQALQALILGLTPKGRYKDLPFGSDHRWDID